MSLGLSRQWWRRREDGGAVGVTFGILLASGVLLGSLAIVVDVGRLYVERGELQNGADSAALALARACSQNDPVCLDEEDLRTLAEEYADANAADGRSTVDFVCGEVPGVLPRCDPQPANSTGCLGTPPDEKYVEVHLSTRMGDGDTVLPPVFAQTLASGNTGTTVGACARAAWGELSAIGLTIRDCVYEAAPHVPEGSPILAADEYVIQFWFWPSPPCWSEGPTGGNPVPNVAGLLTDVDADCEVSMTAEGNFDGSFFNFIPERVATRACLDRLKRAQESGNPVLLPIYDTRTTGDTPSFHHVMVAEFVITAFQVGAPPSVCRPRCTDPETGEDYRSADYRSGSSLTGTNFRVNPCGTPAPGYRCLTGVFVGEPRPLSTLTGDDRIRLVG